MDVSYQPTIGARTLRPKQGVCLMCENIVSPNAAANPQLKGLPRIYILHSRMAFLAKLGLDHRSEHDSVHATG